VPPLSTGETDFRDVPPADRLDFLMREDVVSSDDPLYRAQRRQHDNGLTYLWWSAFQGSAADVSLVEIDAGEGCVRAVAADFRRWQLCAGLSAALRLQPALAVAAAGARLPVAVPNARRSSV